MVRMPSDGIERIVSAGAPNERGDTPIIVQRVPRSHAVIVCQPCRQVFTMPTREVARVVGTA